MGRVEIARLFDWCDLHTSRWRTLPVTAGFISRPLYYDRQGFAIGADGDTPAVIVWAQLNERPDYRSVALDDLPDGSMLSTVWLGIDHGFMGPPLIFESMRFSGSHEVMVMPGSSREVAYRPSLPFPVPGGEPDEETEGLRYTTEEEALAAHHEIRRRLVLRLGS